MRHRRILYFGLGFILFSNLSAQDLELPELFPEYKISLYGQADEGYLFLTTRAVDVKNPASLIITDNYGTPVYYKHLKDASGGFTVNKNGLLTYRSGDKFFCMDSSYHVYDSVLMKDYPMDGHDFLAMENGNYLIFGIDVRTVDLSAYGGETDAQVEGCVIQELDPEHNVVFEWNSWDFFSVEDTYNDLTASIIDKVHPNALEIDNDGSILLLARSMNEVTKINRQTGDIIWRLGGKNNMFTFPDSSQMFSRPHDIQALENGNYTIFDNGNERDPSYSRAIEYKLDETAMTCEIVWSYDADKQVFGRSGGSTRRLPSGNTIIGYGGRASRPASIEVHKDSSLAMRLDFFEDMSTSRALKFPWRTNLFELSKYKVNFGEWDGYTESEYLLDIKNNSDDELTITGYSCHTNAFRIKETFPLSIQPKSEQRVTIIYYPNEINAGYVSDIMTIDSDINSDTLIQRVSQQIELFGTLIDDQPPSGYFSMRQNLLDPTMTDIILEFTEPIYMQGGQEFDYSTIDNLFELKKDDENGESIGFDAVINTDKTIVTVFPEEKLDNSKQYYFSLSDKYEDYYGNQGAALIQIIVGNDDQTGGAAEPGIMIYPNPVREQIYLSMEVESDYHCKLYNITGKLVKSFYIENNSKARLDVNEYEAGIYFLVVSDLVNHNEYTIRILKQ